MLKLIGDNGCISIEVLGYQDASATNRDDRNWLTCRLAASLGEVRFAANCAIQTYDMQSLYEELQGNRHSISLTFPEDVAGITFRVDEGVVTRVKLAWHTSIAQEEVSWSCVISMRKPQLELREDVQSLMLEFPVLL